MHRLKLFSGSSHPKLAERIGRELMKDLSSMKTENYRTGCFQVILESNMRGKHAFLLQTSVANKGDLHTHLWELGEMVWAAENSSAQEVTVITPFCSYALSDHPTTGRMSIAGKVFVTFLEKMGMDRFVGIGFHSPQFAGFFDNETQVDPLPGLPLMIEKLKEKKFEGEEVLVLPGDEGTQDEAETLAEVLDLDVGGVTKTRLEDETPKIVNIKGEVKEKVIMVYDDLICSGGTCRAIAEKLEEMGAKEMCLVSTHAALTEKSVENLNHPLIKEIITTDTVSVKEEIRKALPLTIYTVAPYLAAGIREIHEEGSVSKLHEIPPPPRVHLKQIYP